MASPESYRRAKSLFLVASKLPPGERTRFLSTRCGGDAAIEAHVRRLISADERDPGFLEHPPLIQGAPPPEAGDRLGHFRVLRLLGEGGMGVVYEAQQDEPSRRVALKLVRPGFFSARLRSRFRHEIRILGQLRHPGIAQIYEAGTLELSGEQVPYFAMELVDGRPLLDSARERRLGPRERLGLMAQVCDAVHHAHQKGVIHRDLKPGNILVEDAAAAEGSGDPLAGAPIRARVLDFGVARAIDTQTPAPTQHTHTGQLIGTLPYMSPEQAAGDPAAMDIRSDIYSIGVIAYELLAGRRPYPLEGQSLAAAAVIIRDAEPPPLGTHDRALRGDIETIVAKALQKDPSHRYQSAADLGADIRRHLRDEAILARPASTLYKIGKFARRHRAAVTAAVLVVLAMAGATVVSAWQARIATAARTIAESEKSRADQQAQAATRQARRATLAAAAAAIESGDPISARRFLGTTDAQDRGWAWRYWNARLDESVAMLRPGGDIAGARISPGGDEVTLVMRDGRISRGSPWQPDDRLPPIARLEQATVTLASFTADGRTFAAIHGEGARELGLFDTATGRLVRALPRLEAAGGLLAVSARGDAVYFGIRRVPRAAPAEELWACREAENWTPRLVHRTGGITGLVLSADDRWLVTGFNGAHLYNTRELATIELAMTESGWLHFAWSGDGSLLATGGEEKTVRIWDRAAGAQLRSMRGHSANITALAFDPSGRVLASGATDSLRLWNVGDGTALRPLAGHEGPIRSLVFAEDGGTLLSTSRDGTARLWRADLISDVSVLRGHTSYVYAAAFTPDGSRILSGGWDGAVRAWDAASGLPLATIQTGPDRGYITALAVAPGGATVATGHKIGGWSQSAACLWDATTHELLHELGTARGGVCETVFSDDGKTLWVAWDHHGVDEFDLTATPPARRRAVMRIEPRSLAFARGESEYFVGLKSGDISRIDRASGKVVATLRGHEDWVADLAVHPTRPLLASASADGTARLWDLRDNRCIATLTGHWDNVYAVAFSPDGATLATGSNDTTIIIWDAASAEELTRLRGHDAYIYSLAFSPDGTKLISASGDHTVRVWDTHPVRDRWKARAVIQNGP